MTTSCSEDNKLSVYEIKAKYYTETGQYEKAEQMYKRIISKTRKIYGNESIQVATSMLGLSTVYYLQGKNHENIKIKYQVVDMFENLFQPDDTLLAFFLFEIAGMLYDAKYFNDAEIIYRKTLRIYELASYRNSSGCFSTLVLLGSTLNELDKINEAESLWFAQIEALEKEPHLSFHYLIKAKNRLGRFYIRQNRSHDAEKLYIQLIGMMEKASITKSEIYAVSLTNLGETYILLDKNDQIDTLFQEALEICGNLKDANHDMILYIIETLGEIYFSQGNYYISAEYFQKAITYQKQNHLNYPLDMSTDLAYLANVYSYKENYPKAESLYLEALSIGEQVEGKTHTGYVNNVLNLSDVYRNQTFYHKSESLLVNTILVWEFSKGLDHPEVEEMLNCLAGIYIKMDDQEKARECNQKAQRIRNKINSDSLVVQ